MSNEEVQVKRDEDTGDTIMKKPVRYSRAEPTMQELAAEEAVKEREGSTEETNESITDEPANAEEASFKKRYGDLRRHAQKVSDEKDAELTKIKKQLSEATKKQIKLPKTDEELDAWSAEYPDVARIIETIAIKKSKEMNASIEERLESIAVKEQKSAKQIAEATKQNTENLSKEDLFFKSNTLNAYLKTDFYKSKDIYTDTNLDFFNQIDLGVYSKDIYTTVSLNSYVSNDPVEVHKKNIQRINTKKRQLLAELEALKNE